MRSRIVMDIDDTISTHRNRDYANAVANLEMIHKMQELSKQGIEFVLFTARGQISCNGDIKKIEEKNGPTLRAWLKKYNVPYSELRFGKPIADIYVDDAAMTPDEFLYGTFESYKGGSNEYIERLGKYVVKECSDVDALEVNDWFDVAAENGYNVPKVYSRTYNKMRMEYIMGRPANEIEFDKYKNIAISLAMIAISFAGVPGDYEFDLAKYIQYVVTNNVDPEVESYVAQASRLIAKYGHLITPSFCHGDLTSMNAIVKGNGKIYLIDPKVHKHFSSYLIDLAKLRMSYNKYNKMYYASNVDDDMFLESLDILLRNIGLYDIVRVLEFTCWVRLIKYRYNNKDDYAILLPRLAELSEEMRKYE